MIKNIVFDMGNVLVTYNPRLMLQAFVTSEADIALLLKEISEESEWQDMDRGTMTETEAYDRICSRLPERLHPVCEEILAHWHEYLHPRADVAACVKALKESGYKLYLCSNASLRFHQYKHTIEALQYFDGILISAEELCIKPDPVIYERLFTKFNLNATECFFIDDLLPNIEGAKACGMIGHCFANGDVKALYQAMSEAGIEVVE